MVDCAEFLDSYSDYRDGCLAASRREGFEAHLQACDSCGRYDRVVGGGVQVFRSLPPLTPSPDFQLRLLSRLYGAERPAGHHRSGASIAVTLMICFTLGAGAWIPTLRPKDEPVRLPPIVAHAPYHHFTPILMPRSPAQMRANSVFQAQPVFYGESLLLDQPSAVARLAYRPVGNFYRQR